MRRWGLLGSFGTVSFDNAAMESFWARMQVELLNTRRWATTIELAAAMADFFVSRTLPQLDIRSLGAHDLRHSSCSGTASVTTPYVSSEIWTSHHCHTSACAPMVLM